LKSIASAPAKVILFGEHFVVHGVKAILCSIDKRATVRSQLIDDNVIKIKSKLGNLILPFSSKFTAEHNNNLRPFEYIARKLIQENNLKSGIEIEINSDIPVGVGLGSSSACCVATAASVLGILEKPSREQILKLAIEAEKTIFQKTSGADCSVCTYGGLMEYDIENGFSSLNYKINFSLVIANSKETHSTSEVVHSVQDFKNNNQKLFQSLCNKETEIIRKAISALKNNDLSLLGKLMSENQTLLDQLCIITEKLKVLIKAIINKSYGGKITGAGGGGCVIGLVDNTNLEQTQASLGTHDCEYFTSKIDYNGVS